ncbi:hypothetical protein C7C46_18115 [Streptomyces tateyamensis]|uniref:Uncharacterized protein n=1 Tax=Streptomyces tateyamensis TaxID=565073 RepID=A0A2V4P4C8_9ACTN|nr:hypothetical protein [Streptomyces tateyamensis]PYC77709.1 hypothetical protein C7C46_18115 [Streptomyces tateyamensis]
MTQTASSQREAPAAECAHWEHYGNGHYRPKRGFTGAEILVFEACALLAAQGTGCSVCGGSGVVYRQSVLSDGQAVAERMRCPACANGEHGIDWQRITG